MDIKNIKKSVFVKDININDSSEGINYLRFLGALSKEKTEIDLSNKKDMLFIKKLGILPSPKNEQLINDKLLEFYKFNENKDCIVLVDNNNHTNYLIAFKKDMDDMI